jgi:histidyl-tRNA synthetase
VFQPVRGTHDLYGKECQQYLKIIEIAREIKDRYVYEEIVTPIFEFSGVFHRLGETSDVISKETYNFKDRGGEELTLRPEGTAGVVRAVISNGLAQQIPLKLFYTGPMFRYDRPQKGRFRQFDHIGIELIGVSDPQGDVEVITIATHLLQELGILARVTLEINTLGDLKSRELYREALVAYFTNFKASLSKESLERLEKNPLRILDSKHTQDQELIKDAPVFTDFLSDFSKKHFDKVLTGLDALGINFHVNRKLVRGLDYYCHTAFEFVSHELGAQGTVLAGGRYDGLFRMMGGPDLSAIGWAAGVQRLMMLADLSLRPRELISFIPLGEEADSRALMLSQELRKKGFKIDFSLQGNISKKLKRAHKLGAQRALILGEDEVREQIVLVRDLVSGEQTKVSWSCLVDYLSK